MFNLPLMITKVGIFTAFRMPAMERKHKNLLLIDGIANLTLGVLLLLFPLGAAEIFGVPLPESNFYPTILDILGIPYESEDTDGISMVPLLKGEEKLEREAIYWHFPHYSNHGMQSPGVAVRSGDYKLLEYYEDGRIQLFNLKEDIGEQNDLSDREPEKAAELTEMLHRWRKSIGARMMEPNPDY